MSKYRQLAEKIISDIQSRKLKPEDRMLSLRQFAKQHHISISTAVSCYEELEKQGWIMARPQSGFFITSQPSLLPTPSWQHFTTEIATPVRSFVDSKLTAGPLGMACLELDITTQRALNKSLRRAINQADSCLSRYPNHSGERVLRDALASHFSHTGFALDKDELVITHGCMDAVKTALRVCTHSGDTVAVSSPCYNGLLDLLSVLGLKLIELPSLDDGIDLNELERLFSAKQVQAGLFCSTHMNPQGITMSVEQKQRLSQLAADYQIPIVEDDVYFELNHSNAFNLPTAYYDESGYVIWCGSFSKTLSPSYRLGWCRPGRFLSRYKQQYHGVATLTQFAIADFIQTGAYSRHIKRVRYQLTQNKQNYIHYLTEQLPDGSRISQPDGGLVLWIQVPQLNTNLLSKTASQVGLDIRTGNLFTESQRYQDCLRINIGFAFNDEIRTNLDTLLTLIDESRLDSN